MTFAADASLLQGWRGGNSYADLLLFISQNHCYYVGRQKKDTRVLPLLPPYLYFSQVSAAFLATSRCCWHAGLGAMLAFSLTSPSFNNAYVLVRV